MLLVLRPYAACNTSALMSCADAKQLSMEVMYQFQVVFFAAAMLVIFLPGDDAGCTDSFWCRNKYDTSDRGFYRTHCCLTEVPSDIPAEALEVHLRNNAITSIPAGVFRHLTQCTYLNLGDNQISSVDKEAFQGLKSLQMLYLANNSISSVYIETFQALTSLQVLWLGQNDISSVVLGTFDSLHSLEFLDLEKNKLRTLSPRLFINLPRKPLKLKLGGFSNKWNCSSLCWLKHEEQKGTVTWRDWWGDDAAAPRCATGGDWASLQCGDPGE